MAKWKRDQHGNRRLDLGHGLVLRVWHETAERIPAGRPAYNVEVFGKPLFTRAMGIPEGKRRAEAEARRRMHECILRVIRAID